MLDGEIVVQDEHGLSSFAQLQDALAEGRTHALTFFAFDLLHLDGHDLTAVPLALRKRALPGLLGPVLAPETALQLSEHVTHYTIGRDHGDVSRAEIARASRADPRA